MSIDCIAMRSKIKVVLYVNLNLPRHDRPNKVNPKMRVCFLLSSKRWMFSTSKRYHIHHSIDLHEPCIPLFRLNFDSTSTLSKPEHRKPSKERAVKEYCHNLDNAAMCTVGRASDN